MFALRRVRAALTPLLRRHIQTASYDSATACFSVRFEEGSALSVPLVTLRDLCSCPACWNAQSLQRRQARVEAKAIEPKQVSVEDSCLHVLWEDGHSSCFEGKKLRLLLRPHELPKKELWDASLGVVRQDYKELFTDEGVRALASRIQRLGFAVVRGVPLSKEAGDCVGALVGCKRPTSMYGADWEVKPAAGGNDSAFSTEEILHHTDGCYLSQRPELQLLHCMRPGAGGEGVSSLIDGFAVAEDLKRRDADTYACLSSREVLYQFQDEGHVMLASHPVINMREGEVTSIAWNNYDRACLDSDPAMVNALLRWDAALSDCRWHLDFELRQGELLVFDNHRLLHARKGLQAPQSKRLLYGFYLDSLIHSTLRHPRPLPRPEPAIADFRSDTKTLPTSRMKAAMATAPLGDDVERECPSTLEFEAFMAELLGKEAAILVSSGTQGNLLAIAAQCERGSEFITGSESHVHLWEAGGPSALFGVAQRTVQLDSAGGLPLAELDAALSLSDPQDEHCAATSLVTLENTCGARAGVALEPGYVASVAQLCRHRGLRLHVDGARLGNAAAAWAHSHAEHDLATALRAQLQGVDTVSLCLSKGLGCPGGAVILGDAKTVHRCRRLRKLVGSGTRQAAGLLAAAGLHALRERDVLWELQQDHLRMQVLVAALRELPGVEVQYGGTNMAVVTLAACAAARVAVESASVRLGPPAAGGSWRLVTHRDVGDEDIARVIDVFRRAVRT